MQYYGADAPLSFYAVPRDQRATRRVLSTDACVNDGESHFVRGCIEVPVEGETEPFSWGVWVGSYKQWLEASE